jgi:hypothetical protein
MTGFCQPLSAVFANVNGSNTNDKLVVINTNPSTSISFIVLTIPFIHVSSAGAINTASWKFFSSLIFFARRCAQNMVPTIKLRQSGTAHANKV